MTTAYLSPGTPRWAPTTEQELFQATLDGLLEETHYLELKREVAAGRSANKELARDLAQFAVDGGLLIIGLDEQDAASPCLHPVALAGLPERIEQVARTAIDPPLPVRCTVIGAEDNPRRGYVLVHVPVSATAPHMVDGTYFGRGDKTKNRLSDADVVRLHGLRADTSEMVHAMLAGYVGRDPIPEQVRQQAHLFIVAAPVQPRREMLVEAVDGDSASATLRDLVERGADLASRVSSSFSPDVPELGQFSRRADGAALTTGLTDNRAPLEGHDGRIREDALEVEISDEGTVRLMTTRLSDEAGGQWYLFEDMLPVLVRRALGICAAVSDWAGYNGTWMIGLEANGIAGLPAYGSNFGIGRHTIPTDLETYRSDTVASSEELRQAPGRVAQRLVGRYLRGLGLSKADRFVKLLEDDLPITDSREH